MAVSAISYDWWRDSRGLLRRLRRPLVVQWGEQCCRLNSTNRAAALCSAGEIAWHDWNYSNSIVTVFPVVPGCPE